MTGILLKNQYPGNLPDAPEGHSRLLVNEGGSLVVIDQDRVEAAVVTAKTNPLTGEDGLFVGDRLISATGGPVPTKASLGMDAVDNTSDDQKPVSTAQAAALALKLDSNKVGAALGVASLGSDGKLLMAQVPDSIVSGMKWQSTWNASTNTPAIPAASIGNAGWFYKVAVAGTSSITGSSVAFAVGDWLIGNGAVWQRVPSTEAVVSVNGLTGAVTLNAANIGAMSLTNFGASSKGSLVSGAGPAGVTAVTAAGANGQVLVADSTAGGGIRWATPGASATIVDNLTTGGTTSVLSAEQGKVLKTQVDAKPSLATLAPLAHAASAAVGTSTRAAKEDHVHARGAQPFANFGVYVIRCDSDDLLNNGLVQFTPGEVIHWHGNHDVTILGTSELYLASGFVYEVTCYMRAYTSSDPSGSLTTSWQIKVDGVDAGIGGAFAPPDDSLLIAGSYPAIAFVDCRSVAKLVSVQKNASGGTGPDMRVVTKVMKIASA